MQKVNLVIWCSLNDNSVAIAALILSDDAHAWNVGLWDLMASHERCMDGEIFQKRQ